MPPRELAGIRHPRAGAVDLPERGPGGASRTGRSSGVSERMDAGHPPPGARPARNQAQGFAERGGDIPSSSIGYPDDSSHDHQAGERLAGQWREAATAFADEAAEVVDLHRAEFLQEGF